MIDNIRVAISADFFTAFARLPQAQQGKVGNFITKFQRNPTASGTNYEKIRDAQDPNMRSVRIDQAYRGIVLKPEEGNVYILLWVDHHDEAYEWARRHACTVNSVSGSIQVYETATVEGVAAVPSATSQANVEQPGLFVELKDRELMRLGVPEALLPVVRQVKSEADLDAVENRLPVEAYEGLFMYMAGSRYDEIINGREQPTEQINTNDFAAALSRLETQSRFVVVDDELELQAMLNAPLEKWRVFLHPSQRKLVAGNKTGAVRVLGGAGTGKTVVAMHRAKWLAEKVANDRQKVLFTTFTKNLALDIENNLRSICPPELRQQRIEVINLDRWVMRFLHQHNYHYNILYDTKKSQYWQQALDRMPADLNLPEVFYQEEWQKVIQPQDVETLDQYKQASRIGRGTRLNRVERVKVWPVFEEYRSLLNRHKLREVDDAYRDAAAILENAPGVLPSYSAVVVDEAQDMSTQAFNLLRKIIPEGSNDLFIVGDGHQRIYGRHKVVLGKCGINIRGRSHKLRINYRTTEEIRRVAVNLLEGLAVDDLDGGLDSNDGYKSLTHGGAPQHEHFADAERQADFVVSHLGKVQQEKRLPLGNICIVARINSELDILEARLQAAGIPAQRISADMSNKTNHGQVNLATMHRVKGLEFEQMILVSINQGLVPLAQAIADKGDQVEQRQADLEERALLYVAMTRATKQVLVCSYGEPSPYL